MLPTTAVFSVAAFGAWGITLPSDVHYAAWALLLAGVVGLVRAAVQMRHSRAVPTRIIILGSGALASMLAEECESGEEGRIYAAGMVDDTPPRGPWPWLGRLDHLAEIVERVRPERIVLALQDRRGHLPLEQLLASRVRGVEVEDGLPFYERLTGKMAIEALTPGALILCKGFRNSGPSEWMARLVSVVGAVVGLIVLAPLLAAVAIAIKIDSPGPVFFVQDRAGKDGRGFKLFKFRTMHPSDVHISEWVQDNTGRITRIGHFLRRFRIDELPQLVNILRGEMNIVGPRPHPMTNQRVFMERIAYYGVRSTVRPGVTGWAQVRYGYANNIDEETEKMRYDLYYIKNRTLWLDVKILGETFAILLFGEGSSTVRKPRVHRYATVA